MHDVNLWKSGESRALRSVLRKLTQSRRGLCTSVLSLLKQQKSIYQSSVHVQLSDLETDL